MTFYITFCNYFAIHFEFNTKFGITPFFSTYYCKNEVIVELPFIQIIYTPLKALAEKTDFKYHEQRN